MLATRFISVLLLASTVGCAGLQDTEFAVCNWASAEKNWLTSMSTSERWYISSDYRKGWKEGFKAQLNGTGCYVPAAPPTCYWSPKYRNCEGQEAVAQWYAGWHAGVAAATCKGDHRLPIGDNPPRLLNSNRYGCSVQDGCNGALPCNSSLPCGNDEAVELLTPVDVPSPSNIEPVQQFQPTVEPVDIPLNPLPVPPLNLEDMTGLIGPVGSALVNKSDTVYVAQMPSSKVCCDQY